MDPACASRCDQSNVNLLQSDRKGVLDPIDRVSEMMFGLFMALTFVGAVSAGGADDIKTMFAAAVGCNLAWGVVDGVMHLVGMITERGRLLTLLRTVRAAPDAATGRRLIESALPQAVAKFLTAAEVEAMHARVMSLPSVRERPALHGEDLLAASAIFLVVVASTFPVVLPFIFFDDVGAAKVWSRGIALAMLFGGGLALGRYAGYGSWKAGFAMMGLGAALVALIIWLGG